MQPLAPPISLAGFPRRLRRRETGFTFVEVVVCAGIIVILSVALIGALLSAQNYAAAARMMTNARVIVQRNIDTALGVKFSSASEPTILQVTSAEGVPFGDYQEDADTLLTATNPVPIHIGRTGNTIVQGTMTRIVRAYPSTVTGLVVREVTFRIDYTFNRRPFTYSMTTLRARDDQ